MEMLRLLWPALSARALICLTTLVCMFHVVQAQVQCFSSNDIVVSILLLMGLSSPYFSINEICGPSSALDQIR